MPTESPNVSTIPDGDVNVLAPVNVCVDAREDPVRVDQAIGFPAPWDVATCPLVPATPPRYPIPRLTVLRDTSIKELARVAVDIFVMVI